MSKTLAIFDFDGTITRKDSMVLFLEYCFGTFPMYKKIMPISGKLIRYALGFYSNDQLKADVWALFFKGMKKEIFDEWCENFSQKMIPLICRTNAIEKIKWHREKGHELILLSASPENYLIPWGRNQGLKVIASKIEIIDNKLTGSFLGKNCNYEEKRIRLEAVLNPGSYSEIYAYGDTKGDRAFMELATKKFYRAL